MKRIIGLLLATATGCTLTHAADPSARILAFESTDGVWIASIDGTSATKIAGGQSPDLSVDGTRLAYNTVQDIGKPAHRQIAIANLATGQTTVLKEIPSDNCMAPRWSPNGKRLLLDYYVNNERHIGLVNADGSGFRDIQKSEPVHQNYWAAT